MVRCCECRHWERLDAPVKGIGICHRYPPLPVVCVKDGPRSRIESVQARMGQGEWCGEFLVGDAPVDDETEPDLRLEWPDGQPVNAGGGLPAEETVLLGDPRIDPPLIAPGVLDKLDIEVLPDGKLFVRDC